jgi:hypothetical protein
MPAAYCGPGSPSEIWGILCFPGYLVGLVLGLILPVPGDQQGGTWPWSNLAFVFHGTRKFSGKCSVLSECPRVVTVTAPAHTASQPSVALPIWNCLG